MVRWEQMMEYVGHFWIYLQDTSTWRPCPYDTLAAKYETKSAPSLISEFHFILMYNLHSLISFGFYFVIAS